MSESEKSSNALVDSFNKMVYVIFLLLLFFTAEVIIIIIIIIIIIFINNAILETRRDEMR